MTRFQLRLLKAYTAVCGYGLLGWLWAFRAIE